MLSSSKTSSAPSKQRRRLQVEAPAETSEIYIISVSWFRIYNIMALLRPAHKLHIRIIASRIYSYSTPLNSHSSLFVKPRFFFSHFTYNCCWVGLLRDFGIVGKFRFKYVLWRRSLFVKLTSNFWRSSWIACFWMSSFMILVS